MSDSHTGTSSASNTRSASASMTAYPSRTPLVAAGVSRTGPDSNNTGYIAVGAISGVLLGIFGMTIWNFTKSQQKRRRSVHLSPTIMFNTLPKSESLSELKNTSFRIHQKRVEFDPVPMP